MVVDSWLAQQGSLDESAQTVMLIVVGSLILAWGLASVVAYETSLRPSIVEEDSIP